MSVMALNTCGEIPASSSHLRGEISAQKLDGVRVSSRTMNAGELILARILKRLERVGLSENAVGQQAGLSRDIIRSIRRGIEGGRQRGVSSGTLEKLAPVLRTTPQWLLTGQGVEDTGLAEIQAEEAADQVEALTGATPSDVIAADVEAPKPWTFSNDLPVHGTAAGSIINEVEGILIERDIVDYVRRPPALMGNREAYAVYVTGDSMAPLHKRGELRLVDPRRRPAIEDSVVVTTKHHEHDPGQAYIKILKRRTPQFLVLEQLNPHATLQIPVQFVVSTHKVLTMDDLFGV